MRKLIFLLLLLPSIALAGFLVDGVTDPASVDGVATPASVDGVASDYCLSEYDPSPTDDASRYFSRYSGEEYMGMIYNPDSNQCICAVDFMLGERAGTFDANDDFYMRIFLLDGANALDDYTSPLGTSAKIDGDDWNTNNVMISTTSSGNITFSPCVNVSSGSSYALVLFLDNDGNPNDSPEYDETNYHFWRYDDEANVAHGDTIQEGWCHWDPDDGTISGTPDNDDLMDIIVYTEQ